MAATIDETFDVFDESLKTNERTRRHYKKDSRFVFDLYTLCYDENESVDTVELFTSIVNNTAGNWKEEVNLCSKKTSTQKLKLIINYIFVFEKNKTGIIKFI